MAKPEDDKVEKSVDDGEEEPATETDGTTVIQQEEVDEKTEPTAEVKPEEPATTQPEPSEASETTVSSQPTAEVTAASAETKEVTELETPATAMEQESTESTTAATASSEWMTMLTYSHQGWYVDLFPVCVAAVAISHCTEFDLTARKEISVNQIGMVVVHENHFIALRICS